jgi:hypothetical protein
VGIDSSLDVHYSTHYYIYDNKDKNNSKYTVVRMNSTNTCAALDFEPLVCTLPGTVYFVGFLWIYRTL